MKLTTGFIPYLLVAVLITQTTTSRANPAPETTTIEVDERSSPERIRRLTRLPNGRAISEVNYIVRDGQPIKHGPAFGWNHEGTLRSVQSWEQGKRAGVWLFYSDSSELVLLYTFVDGACVERKQWDTNGYLRSEWIRRSDRFHVKDYDEHGRIIRERFMPEQSNQPNKAPEPTPMSVTSPAEQEPRRP